MRDLSDHERLLREQEEHRYTRERLYNAEDCINQMIALLPNNEWAEMRQQLLNYKEGTGRYHKPRRPLHWEYGDA